MSATAANFKLKSSGTAATALLLLSAVAGQISPGPSIFSLCSCNFRQDKRSHCVRAAPLSKAGNVTKPSI